MPDELTVSFQYSASEHAKAIHEWDTGIRFQVLLPAVILPPLVWHVVRYRASTPWWIDLILTALVVLPAYSAPWFMRWRNRRRFQRDLADGGEAIRVCTFSDAGYTPGGRWSNPIPWSKIQQVQETKNFILIPALSDGWTYIPKHALAESDLTRLRTLLRAQFQNRPKRLGLRREKAPLLTPSA